MAQHYELLGLEGEAELQGQVEGAPGPAASYSPHVIFEKDLYRTGAIMAFFGLMR